MHGQLFSLFGVGFPSYFVLLLTGFIFATAVGALWARRIGQDPDVVVDLGLAMLLAGVAGARILHVLADGYFWDYVHLCTGPLDKIDWSITQAECLSPSYGGAWDAAKNVCHPTQTDCFAWAKFWAGGLTYYGGLIGATVAAWYLMKRDRFPFWKAADMAGLTIPIGLGFGRMGCLLAGCCFGKVWEGGPLAMVFPSHSPASEMQYQQHLIGSPLFESLPVYPTQVLESLGSLLIAVLLIWYLHGRKRYDGQIFLAFIALYAILRFVLEFFRDDARGGALGLSTSQLIGLALVAAVVVLHRALVARVTGGSPPAAPSPEPAA
ncbi:MAG: prolipoprotein diacylglyceryl transferase [Sorangiineae bacterium]|nr:prolipoprotein diacylglyceryl transferase [Polyangiaceae bacterium]MEB2323946.1 prolipoprotein diacylglyceryl transferase [Sorangiineae bacterium]